MFASSVEFAVGYTNLRLSRRTIWRRPTGEKVAFGERGLNVMKQVAKKRAVASVVLGAIAVVFACVHGRWLRFLAFPLAIFAIWLGVSALAAVARSQWSVQRRRIPSAFLGGGFGILAIVLSVFFPRDRIAIGVNRQPSRQDRFGQSSESIPRRLRAETNATNFTSNLPIIVIHSDGRDIESERLSLMRAQFFDVDAGNHRASLGATPAHDGAVTIHVRGSSSQRLPKSSYTFHTVENRTNQIQVSLLGLPKEEDWVLYAPYEDKTLMRDVLAFELARQSGHYAPRTRYVELFITSSAGRLTMRDYVGVYVLMEKIKRGSDRVNIAKLDTQASSAPEISGGYIVKRDHQERGGARFSTSRGGPYFFVYPNSRKVTSAQRAWLADYFRSFESSLYGPEFTNPRTGYAAYLDVDSFIDAHWLIEMSKNVDGFRYSAFITKDRDGRLRTEPPWDWNRSFGNANYYGGWQPNGWYWPLLRSTEISWFHRLREDPEFVRRCNTRWSELRRGAFDLPKILEIVDTLAAQLGEAQVRNFKRWPILGEQVTCNYYVGGSYEEEVKWLKNWIVGRVAWIDRDVAVNSASGLKTQTEGLQE